MITTLIASVVSVGAFKCAMTTEPQVAMSADQKVKVVVLHDGKLNLYRKGSAYANLAGQWGGFGHHQQVVMSRDGSAFAIYDRYAGMEVFNSKGKKVAFLEPSKVLSKKEMEAIPGKWTCHTEGTWLDKPSFDFKKDRLEFTIYNGRKVRVDL